ncbi:hypothetical protein DRI50_01395 [candidate division KSB1 bacterium]|nr:MAG: hypothetical protein DRI50_01395 [candidate division KSB1 bacterium]
MQRFALKDLIRWKNKKDRKPLILKGARQVGKTYLLKTFGRTEFRAYHHFDFERDKKQLLPVFEEELSPKKIVRNLSLLSDKVIDLENDLIIFDEIQNIPRALTALKYFQEEMPRLAVCAAGSLLGITLSDVSFPVGKVEFLNLYPLSFEEFLFNYENSLLYEAFLEGLEKRSVPLAVHQKFLEILKEYYVVGGMPEMVHTYLAKKNENPNIFQEIRKKQTDLLNTLKADFSKHSGKVNALHIASVYENIPLQLAQYTDTSVKRFRFKNVVKGKKGYTELSGPISWLENAQLIIKVLIANRAQLPLRAFCKENIFKLYLNDIGLLGAMLEIPPVSIILANYGTSKGFFVENFVAMELRATLDSQLYAWNERNSEIEFLLIHEDNIIPVEVKAGLRTKAKSLQQYILKYAPKTALMLSEKNFSTKDSVRRNIPLYYAGNLKQLV